MQQLTSTCSTPHGNGSGTDLSGAEPTLTDTHHHAGCGKYERELNEERQWLWPGGVKQSLIPAVDVSEPWKRRRLLLCLCATYILWLHMQVIKKKIRIFTFNQDAAQPQDRQTQMFLDERDKQFLSRGVNSNWSTGSCLIGRRSNQSGLTSSQWAGINRAISISAASWQEARVASCDHTAWLVEVVFLLLQSLQQGNKTQSFCIWFVKKIKCGRQMWKANAEASRN